MKTSSFKKKEGESAEDVFKRLFAPKPGEKEISLKIKDKEYNRLHRRNKNLTRIIEMKEKWNSGKFDLNDKNLNKNEKQVKIRDPNPISEGSLSSDDIRSKTSPVPRFQTENSALRNSKDEDIQFKNKEYYNLPENVRNAIDMAKLKNNKSEFYYKLSNLNEKILLFRSIYYSKVPNFHLSFLEKKKKALKEKLAKEKEQMKREYEELNHKLLRL